VRPTGDVLDLRELAAPAGDREQGDWHAAAGDRLPERLLRRIAKSAGQPGPANDDPVGADELGFELGQGGSESAFSSTVHELFRPCTGYSVGLRVTAANKYRCQKADTQ
jgi:hypothetical protein